MIKSPTTFVLGAGASMPYRFPSGIQLKNWICEAVKDEDLIARQLTQHLKVSQPKIQDFARAFQRSRINSIDAFLLRRPEFSQIGKYAIAAHLCRLENVDVLDALENENSWYDLLWNKMVEGTHEARDVTNNQVRFVSFNYDRSLERFLFGACKNTYGVADAEAYEISSKVSIIHVYGLLGRFHYGGDAGEYRAYDSSVSAETLQIAANGIRLIPEDRSDNRDFLLARNWMDWAERVCFLGFGFDPTNCENLGLVDILERKQSNGKPLPNVFASTLKLTDQEAEQARRLVCGITGFWQSRPSDNVMTLRELGVLF